jgi:Asp-tRNA(Asn)/Glu-tRNA(Gln) amidotransferase B subunit
MRKKGIKILSAILVIVLVMSFATVALAADQEGAEPKGERKPSRSNAALFLKYAPDSLADYLSTKQEHEAFHEGRKTVHETFKSQAKGNVNELIDALIAGEMTVEEFTSAVTEMRDTLKDFKAQMESIREAKKAENEPLKTQRESIQTQMKTALAAEVKDEALIKSLLEQSLELLKQHLAVDYKYAAQVDAARAQYFPE